MPIIYHVATKADWDKAIQQGFYEHPSLAVEGFIHCSEEYQLPGVLERFFEGQTNLFKLVIDTDKLTSKIVFDWSPSVADTFPHIYGAINLDAVIKVVPL
jgi:uncharacterized protein (DUF952 family)